MHRQHRAFTLIELLVVIAIIGILSAIIIASLGLARDRGNDTAVKKAMVEARTQAELFYSANGDRYSVSLGDTTTNACDVAGLAAGTRSMYNSFKSAADAAGVSGANIQTSYTLNGGTGKATCHACPPGIPSGNCGNANSNNWAMEVPLKAGGFWCMDGLGYNGPTAASTIASGDSRCN